MESALKELIGSGVLGATLAIVLLFLLWAGKKMLTVFIEQTQELSAAIKELTASQIAIRDNCRACRTDWVASVRDAQVAIEAKVDGVVWKAHEQAVSANRDMIGAAIRTLDSALTGAAQSIRSSNVELVQAVENQHLRKENEELSRPHFAPESGTVRR